MKLLEKIRGFLRTEELRFSPLPRRRSGRRKPVNPAEKPLP